MSLALKQHKGAVQPPQYGRTSEFVRNYHPESDDPSGWFQFNCADSTVAQAADGSNVYVTLFEETGAAGYFQEALGVSALPEGAQMLSSFYAKPGAQNYIGFNIRTPNADQSSR